jgi:hypothetical protein
VELELGLWRGGAALDHSPVDLRPRDGAARVLVWRARYFAQYPTRDELPEHDLAGYDLVQEIERRYLAGAYARQEIAFDPRHDERYDWTADYADIPNRRPIPELMFVASPGRTVEHDTTYDEGYPPGVDRDADADA